MHRCLSLVIHAPWMALTEQKNGVAGHFPVLMPLHIVVVIVQTLGPVQLLRPYGL